MKKAKMAGMMVVAGFLASAFTGCLQSPEMGTTAPDASEPVAARSSRPDTDLAARGVFIMSNAVEGNSIMAYQRGNDGSLTYIGSYPTGGKGTGAGLGNQGGVRAVEGFVFAVNNASNDISVLKVGRKGLTLACKAPSGGSMPISIAVHDDQVFVLNAGGEGNISGFRLRHANGELSPLHDSTRPLSGPAAGPAQIEFDPDGRLLVVTEKAANRIDVYPVDARGHVGNAVSQASVGMTPYGFGFTPKGVLVVSDAFGGMAGMGAMTSYRVNARHGATAISGPVADGQTAPCWVAVSGDGRFAYATNAASGNISSYALNRQGALSLIQGVAGNTGMGSSPTDVSLGGNSRYLYVNGSKSHAIGVFRVDSGTGALTAVASAIVLPTGANGMAAF
jgi:6-phosphogluconolactonase (cycloisomerase 2 family)